MKGLAGKQSRGLPTGANLTCADNSGAKIIRIIEVPKYHGRAKRQPRAGIGDIIIASVKKGTPEMRKKVVYAVIIRQKKPYRRTDGMTVQFEDNAAVVVSPTGETTGSDVKGCVAREAAERWPRVAAIASTIV